MHMLLLITSTEWLGEDESNNPKIRKKLNILKRALHGTKTTVIFISHQMKDTTKVDDSYVTRGGGDLINMARGVIRIFKMDTKEKEYLALRREANKSKHQFEGGIYYKITSKNVEDTITYREGGKTKKRGCKK